MQKLPRTRYEGIALWEFKRAPQTAALIKRVVKSPGGIALDLGCGSGAVMTEMAQLFEFIVGVDIDHSVLNPSNKVRKPNEYLLVADVRHLPIASWRVQLVYSYGALHHVDESDALAEVRRVLKPGGLAVLVDFVNNIGHHSTRRFGLYLEAMRALPGMVVHYGTLAGLRIFLWRLSPRWLRHVRADRFLTASEFSYVYRSALPGCAIKWLPPRRMVAIWRQPSPAKEEQS